MGSRGYIRNVATSLIGQLGIRVETFIYNPHWFWLQHRNQIGDAVDKMSPQTLGRIVACGGRGRHSIYDTCCGDYHVRNGADGMQMLRVLAVIVIAAEMTEILRDGSPKRTRAPQESPA